MVSLRLLSRQILNDTLHRYFFPPDLPSFEAVVQEHSVAFFPCLGETLLQGLRLETPSLYHVLDWPGRSVVVAGLVDDRKQQLE
jgi:hypothetical protein